MADDYTVTLVFTGEEKGVPVYRFSAVPAPDAAVVWGKIEITVRQPDLRPLSQRFYDEDGVAVRELTFSDFRETAGRVIARQMEMRPLDKPDEFTRMTWKDLEYDVGLDEGFFTLRRLRASR